MNLITHEKKFNELIPIDEFNKHMYEMIMHKLGNVLIKFEEWSDAYLVIMQYISVFGNNNIIILKQLG